MNSSRKKVLTDRMKSYLVGIYKIEEERTVARIGEIADILGVESPSAHTMVKMLAKYNMVEYEKYGYIKLTKEGKMVAKQLINKTNIIKYFLIKYLGVDENVAVDDANSIKNILSNDTFIKLKRLVYFLDNRPDHSDINCPEEIEAFSQT